MLNDFGYLRKNDWFHIGVGSKITLIDFKNLEELKELELGIDFNYDSDTSGNSNPFGIGAKEGIGFYIVLNYGFSLGKILYQKK